MSNESEFKSARKIRTERNKLVEAINRRRIDTTNDLKEVGDNLIESVDEIYSTIVTPFEIEDKNRKELAAKKELEKQMVIDADRKKIASFRGFVLDANNGDSKSVSSSIDALTNIDCSVFHKDLIHEAIRAKEDCLVELTTLLSSKLALEESERARKEAEEKLAKFEASQSPNLNKEAEPKVIQSETVTANPKAQQSRPAVSERHWLYIAADRVAAGEREQDVLTEYGYSHSDQENKAA